MDKNGLRDHEVAAAVDISRVQVSRIRRGVGSTSIATAKKLAKLTKIPWTAFVQTEPQKRGRKAR